MVIDVYNSCVIRSNLSFRRDPPSLPLSLPVRQLILVLHISTIQALYWVHIWEMGNVLMPGSNLKGKRPFTAWTIFAAVLYKQKETPPF